jgi:predicted cupin superfamily sugar epimerase
MTTAEKLIAHLQLQPHPKEGGFFRETYRSADRLTALPGRYGSDRCAGTAIYYLLTPNTFSAMHLLQSDEIFHFYLGSPVRMLQLHPDGRGEEFVLGADVPAGQRPQLVVPRGVWQGSCLEPGGEFALLGCTVAPGFEYVDYAHGRREELIARYAGFERQIKRLTAE